MKPDELAQVIFTELESLPEMRTAPMRRVRREYSKRLRSKPAWFVLELARLIINSRQHRWIAYEIIHDHDVAFRSLDREKLEELGKGIDSWSSVDSFSRTLSGPAWRDGIIGSDTIHEWAHSPDRWWRRAALVSTVALNVRSLGGEGDIDRTLAICEILMDDHDDMIVKALSWALRELTVHDPEDVRQFLSVNEHVLASRIKREVRNKLKTGLKNP
jgi:3-methyladenine DNA glycosylase AlkD